MSAYFDPSTQPDGHVARLVRELRTAFDRVRKDARDTEARLTAAIEAISTGGGAPTDSDYLTCTVHAELPNARVLNAGANVTFDDSVANVRTVNVSAGLTAEQIEDLVAAMVTDTASVLWTYTDGSSQLEANVPAEFIQDTVGAMVVGGTGITATYSDVGGTVTIATTITQYTDEMVDDRVASLLVPGNGIDFVYTDGSNTLEVIVDESELAMQAPSYVCLANTAALPNERRLREGHGIDITDGGAGADVTVLVDESEFSLGDGLLWTGTELAVDYAAVANRVIYSVDFTTLANNTFVNGTETIDGLNWTAAAVSNSTRTIFDILNGTGLRWTAPTSAATVFSTSSQTAAHIYIDLSAFTLWRPEECLIVELQYSGTFENGNDGLRFGLWGQANTPSSAGTASAIRMDMLDRVNSGGTQALRAQHQATPFNFEVDPSGTDVVMGKFYNDGTIDGFYGTYSGGFPTNAYLPSGRQTTAQGAKNPMMCANTRLVLSFICASDASPTSAVTITRMRLRRGI